MTFFCRSHVKARRIPAPPSRRPMRQAGTALGLLVLALIALGSQSAGAQSVAGFLGDFSEGPGFYRAYQSQHIPEPDLQNSPAISQMIRDGRISLSLRQLLALTLQN
ncbi:MAG: hypothetical protein HY648_04645, partial [Acidobacteria bacterium]|nr:hypothetical protein [Acidobacteriota bacterium]